MGSSPRSSATSVRSWLKSRRSCKKSATDPLPEAFASRYAAEAVGGALQAGRVERWQPVACLTQHRVTVFGQPLQGVQQVDRQELGRQLLGEARLHAEIELPVAEPEDAVAL